MTRIIAGRSKGRRLAVPSGSTTRPTSDRAREALFSTVTAMGGDLAGAHVLDLYAGSGAVGLEALSRGAARALFVESDARALRTLRSNVAVVGLPGATVIGGRVLPRIAAGPVDETAYDVAFLDPPYAMPAAEPSAVVAALTDRGWLAAGSLVVVERAGRDAPWIWPAGVEPVGNRSYGDATLWYGRALTDAGA